MKFTKFAAAVLACLAMTLIAQGQEKKMEKKGGAKAPAKMEMPKPGAEVKKLGYFVGSWSMEGEMKENAFGMPAGPFTGDNKCEWFAGGWQVVCHTTSKGAMGASRGIGILAYNGEDKVYTYYGIDSTGYGGLSKGKQDGSTWVYTSDEKMMGKSFHGRYTIDTSSPDSYTFKYETSEDGQKWSTMMEGKSTKAAAAKKS